MCLPILALSQGKDEVFAVKAIPNSFRIVPETSFLYQGISQRFRIIMGEGSQVDSINFDGGSMIRHDSILTVKVGKIKSAQLRAYNIINGKPELIYLKEFDVKTFKGPKPNLDGVDNDSAIYKMRAVGMGYVNVPINSDPQLKRAGYKVLSFDMACTDSTGSYKAMSATGNRMSLEMKNTVDNMKNGGVMLFSNIRYQVGEDSIYSDQTLRVFVLDGIVTKF